MLNTTSTFTTIKLGPLSIPAASCDGELFFPVHTLCKKLKLSTVPRELVSSTTILHGEEGAMYVAVSEAGLYRLLLRSTAKEARPFQNWISQCILPAVLLERYYFSGEERVGETRGTSVDPKEDCGAVPETLHTWLAYVVLPTIRKEGKFFADLYDQDGAFNPQGLQDRELQHRKSDIMWASFSPKYTRLHNQLSRRRFARVAKQIRGLNALIGDETSKAA